jgi:hypothetical protein
MMRVALTTALVLLAAAPALSAAEDRPTGENCDLSSPPVSAGEEFSHGIVLRVVPRAKDIGPTYTGCQAVLAPDGEKWVVVSLTEVVKGDPIRVWSEYEKDPAVLACRFGGGNLVKGDPKKCPMPAFLLFRSLAPGCVRIIKEAVAKDGIGAPRPPECDYQ